MRSLPSMRVLAAVAEHGGFSAAGAALGMTQSAVSQHVAALERQTGSTLVRRGTRPLELTEAGIVLAQHARAAAGLLATAERDLSEVIGRSARTLRLGAFPTALATFVPPALARLRARLPEVRVVVSDEHMPDLLPRLLDRELDLAVVFGADDPGLGRDLEIAHLFADEYRAVLPADHRWVGGPAGPRLADLADETWVGGTAHSTWFRVVRDACRSAGFEPRVELVSDDHLAVQAFVAAGLGVAVVPGLAAARVLAGVRARALRGPAPSRTIQVARLREAYRSPAADLMVSLLQDATAQAT